ncbi:hypothetical protein WN943_003428 [Citrus x changshan-huyou]
MKSSSSSKMPRFFLLCKKPSSLPLIHKSLSSSFSQTLLYSHVDLLLSHFLSYYDALDNAATQENLPELLFRSWHNRLEIPLSWQSRRCKVRIALDWVAFEGQSDEGLKGVIVEAMKKEMDDTVSVFVYANRLKKKRNEVMGWRNRMMVAKGTARGLRYLHEDCRVGCIVF